MKKMPIELLTTRTADAANGCVVIWDGFSIALATDPELNLINIQRSLATLTRLSSELVTNQDATTQELARLNPTVTSLNLLLPDIAQRLNSIEQIVSSDTGFTVRLAHVEERVNSLEQDITQIIQGGGGDGGGGGLSSTWSAILTALSAGSYITGAGGITVEKVSTGSAAGQYVIRLTDQPVSTSVAAADDIIRVTSKPDGVFAVGIDPTKFSNYITATAGLKVDSRISDRVVIRPDASLITGDNSTIQVSFNDISGQFKIEAINVATGGGSGVMLDNKTLTRLIDGSVAVSSNYLRTPYGEMSYKSAKFDELLTAASNSRFSAMSEADFLQRLTTKGIADKAAAIANSGFTGALKTFVFNSANAPLLVGRIFLLKDFNSAQSAVEFVSNGAVIDAAAEVKNCQFDFDLQVRVENLNYPPLKFGSNLPLAIENLTIPFAIYVLENITTGKICAIMGDVLRYGLVSANGNGGQLQLQTQTMTSNADLESKNLIPGLYRTTAYIGFKVGTSAETAFTSGFIDKYAVEPSFRSKLAFL